VVLADHATQGLVAYKMGLEDGPGVCDSQSSTEYSDDDYQGKS
jgi:hypothetical protein